MTFEYVANTSLTASFTMTAGPPDRVYTGDQGLSAQLATTQSPTVSAVGSPVCTTQITATWTVGTGGCPYTSATYNFVAGGGVLLATTVKVLADGQPVLRENDTGTCAGGWTLKASPFTPLPCSCTTSLSSAGQTKVKAQ